MKIIPYIFYGAIILVAFYGIITLKSNDWRQGVPYLALILAASARLKQETGI